MKSPVERVGLCRRAAGCRSGTVGVGWRPWYRCPGRVRVVAAAVRDLPHPEPAVAVGAADLGVRHGDRAVAVGVGGAGRRRRRAAGRGVVEAERRRQPACRPRSASVRLPPTLTVITALLPVAGGTTWALTPPSSSLRRGCGFGRCGRGGGLAVGSSVDSTDRSRLVGGRRSGRIARSGRAAGQRSARRPRRLTGRLARRLRWRRRLLVGRGVVPAVLVRVGLSAFFASGGGCVRRARRRRGVGRERCTERQRH